MASETLRETVKQILDRLPEEATEKELHEFLVVRREIARGIADGDADRVISTAELRRSFALSEEATLTDVAYQIYVRKKIDRGFAQSEADDVVSHEEILREFGDVECP